MGTACGISSWAHLANATYGSDLELFYWRKGNDEVDFVLKRGQKIIGIEVKSGVSGYHRGSAVFKDKYQPHKMLLVGGSGLSWEEFLLIDPNALF